MGLLGAWYSSPSAHGQGRGCPAWRRIHTQPLTQVPHVQAAMLVAGARTLPRWMCAQDDLFAFICGLLTAIPADVCMHRGTHSAPPPGYPALCRLVHS